MNALQIVKSLIGSVIGAVPGILMLIYARPYAPIGILIAVLCLGTFIGFALTLPGVSALRVMKGTGGIIAAHNAPRSMRDGIIGAAFDDDETRDSEQR